MDTITTCVELAQEHLADARHQAIAEQNEAVFEIANGRVSPLIRAVEKVAALQVAMQQLDCILKDQLLTGDQ